MVQITSGGVSFPLAGNGGTLATTQPVLDLTATWATTGTYVGAIRLNVTDSGPANVASLLMDLQVGGVSKFNVTKGGILTAPGGIAAAGGLYVGATQATSSVAVGNTAGGVTVQAAGDFSWSTTSNASTATRDLFLLREAANTLAQRNGTSPQAFRIFNTYTDSSNNEYGTFSWSGGKLFFGTNFIGTGVSRTITIITNGASPIEFWTTGLFRWQVDGSGNLTAGTDNTYDIGASGATRPRNYFGAGLVQTGAVAVASLPTCNAAAKASRHFVTDANATFTAGIGAVVAAGGANNVPVVCDGSNWRIG